MVKALLIVVALAIVGFVAYNHTQGNSSEDRQVSELAQSFERAKQQFAQASRGAAIGGLDTTGDVEAVQASVRKIAAELAGLKKRLKSPGSIRHAEELSKEVAEFSRQLR